MHFELARREGVAKRGFDADVRRRDVRPQPFAVVAACAAVLLAGLMGAWRNLDRTGIRTLLLCLAALAAGWSCTVRYAGVFLILAGLAAILAWPRMRTSGAEAKPFPTRQRLLGATTFAMVAALLPAAQTLFNLWILGRPTSRALAYHPPPGAKFRQLFDTIGWWLVPEIPSRWHVQLMTWAGVIALALLTLLPPIIALWRWQRRHQRPSAWTVTVWVFAAGYTPFVVVAHTWQDAGIPFNTRIFFPLFFAGWTFAVAAMARALSQPSRGQLRFLGTGAALTVAVLILASVGDHGRQELVRRHNIGWGFEGPRWRSNRLLQTIQNDHGSVKSRPLVGNAGDLVGLTTHRRMGHVPKWFSRPRGQPYRRMPGQYRQLGRWAMSADGRIVYFNAMHDRYDYLSSEAMLAEHLHLKLLVQNRDGRVYAVAAVKGFEDRDYDSDGRPDWENLEEPVRSDVIDHHRARAPLPGDAD